MGDYKKEWYVVLGMLDGYDYIFGTHPEKPDDKTTIKLWIRATGVNFRSLQRKRDG